MSEQQQPGVPQHPGAQHAPQVPPVPQAPTVPPIPQAPFATPYPGAPQGPQPTAAHYPTAHSPTAQYPTVPQYPTVQYPTVPQYPAVPQYAAPQQPGFTAAYALPPGAIFAPAAPARGAALGVVALFASLVAFLVTPVVGAMAAYQIGLGAAKDVTVNGFDEGSSDFAWGLLSPVRDWVLLAEVSFWTGTALGVWAIVQGIVAIRQRRGRGAGIAAIVVAALGPVVFGFAVYLTLIMGAVSGASIGG